MRVILPEYELAASALGKQKVQPGPLRASRYSLRVPCEDGTLLYHTMTGAMLLLPPDEDESLLREELVRRRFLVPEALDEYKLASQLRLVAALLQPKAEAVTSFLLYPTTDCNARCFYCYELGRSRVPMSDEVARDAAAYIARVSRGEKVRLTWFGGEPLFNRRAIEIVCRELERLGVCFRSRMVSNGYLFDAETVQTAREDWKLSFVQITLDGTEENYNRSKAFIYRDGSPYRRVLRNIGLLLDAGVSVDIRLNLNRDNYEDLLRLCDVLAELFPGRKNLHVYTVLLRDFGHEVRGFEEGELPLRRYETLRKRIAAKGLGRARPLKRAMQLNQCMADSDESLTILPDGRIGKCEHETEENLIGDIYQGITDPAMQAAWKERISIPECRECAFYPFCIKIKKCAWHANGCTEHTRMTMRSNIEERVRETYRQIRDSAGNDQETCQSEREEWEETL